MILAYDRSVILVRPATSLCVFELCDIETARSQHHLRNQSAFR